MTVLPYTCLRNQYNEISEKRQVILKLKERLLDIETEQSSGAKKYSIDELDAALKELFY